MSSRKRIITYASLGLSAFACLTFLIILLINGLIKSNLIQLADPTVIDKSIWAVIGVFILGLASAALSDVDSARKFLFGKKLEHGSNSAIILISSLGIIVFINIIIFQNPKSWDLTESKTNTLSPETITLLGSIPSKISASAYFSSQSDQTQARKVLASFAEASPKNFSYTFIDPVTNPLAAQSDGIDQDGTIVLHMGNNKEPVTFSGEEEIDIAIIKLINPIKNPIYFSTGHGEAELSTPDDTSYSLVKTGLENKNYTVNSINLGKSFPSDAKVIVIAGPKTGFSDNEINNLVKFQANGGSLIILDDPLMLTDTNNENRLLEKYLFNWGIKENNDIIFDPKANPSLLVYADPGNYGQHPITNNLRGFNSRFFTAHSLSISQTENILLTPLAQTYTDAWGEVNKSSIEKNNVVFDQPEDNSGPLIIAVAGENSKNNSRLVVLGDSDFAANALYKQGYGTLLMNSIDWACKQEKLIALTPKNNVTRTYNPPGSAGLILIIVSSICILPLMIFMAGIYSWIQRKKKG